MSQRINRISQAHPVKRMSGANSQTSCCETTVRADELFSVPCVTQKKILSVSAQTAPTSIFNRQRDVLNQSKALEG